MDNSTVPFKGPEHIINLLMELRLAGSALNARVDAMAFPLAFMEQMPIPAWIKLLDEKTGELRMIRVNKAWEVQVGLRLIDCIGRPDRQIGPVGSDQQDVAEWEKNDQLVLSTGQLVQAEETSHFRDGSTQIWKVHKWPLTIDGEVMGVCGFAEEVRDA